MGASKRRKAEIETLRATSFPKEIVATWESDRGLAFAIALGRRSGWLLHVDWLVNAENFQAATVRIPVRAYVGTDMDDIFDIRGAFKVKAYTAGVIRPQVERIVTRGRLTGLAQVGVTSRTYDSHDMSPLIDLGLAIDEDRIAAALKEIEARPLYLASIPARPHPALPAKDAADFAWGNCAPFAEALHEVTGLPVVAMASHDFEPNWRPRSIGAEGYLHSLVLHADGTGEDSWGRLPLESIARRYNLRSWRLDADLHDSTVAKLKRNSPQEYSVTKERAAALIRRYRSVD